MDMHKQGMYVVIDPDGAPVMESFATTGHSARTEFCRAHNKLWSKSVTAGFDIAELVIVGTTRKPCSFEHTKAAARIYRESQAARAAAWAAADSVEAIDACVAADESDGQLVRLAFYKDTCGLNSWDRIRGIHPMDLICKFAPEEKRHEPANT